MIKKIMIDTHTHTVLSGHAWSTLRENAVAAAAKGIAGMCLTEHAYSMPASGPFFLSEAQHMLPREIAGVRVFYGIEANIMDTGGGLDVTDRMLFACEWVVASMHDVCMRPGNEDENTRAFKRALNHPAVDILGHIDDMKALCNLESVVCEAAKLNKLVEINNNSILIRKGSKQRVEEIARLCMKHGVRVAVASDAHFDTMIGSVTPALEMLAEVGFPDDLVINRDLAIFEAYLAERAKRLDSMRESYISSRRSARLSAKK